MTDDTQAREDWEGLTLSMRHTLRWHVERVGRPHVLSSEALKRRGLVRRGSATARGLAALAYGRSLEGTDGR